ncbi:protein ALP1-like [Leptopilina heterotoma]|uniref:protein ALP1-like n=1 Tax=Leptopilina heterotoma TaxID=63436 RepID=UPI001CA8224A|nr:protein ALP1-like [Leptopilina heterotoma]
MDLIPAVQVSLSWLRMVNLYLEHKYKEEHWRRYWVKPHLYPSIRNMYGAFAVTFEYMKRSNHEDFYDIYRMKECQFDELHEMLRLNLEKSYVVREPLSSELRLAVMLHYLAQGDSVKTLSRYYLIGKSTMYEIIAQVSKAIWDILSKIYLKNKTPVEWQAVADEYEKKWKFPNCIGAIDGKHIRIIKPPHSGSTFFNYKKYFSFVLMALCDADYKFTWIDVGDYGSLSDSSVFDATGFAQELTSGRYLLPKARCLPGTNSVLPYFIIGDAGFGLKTFLMRPYSQKFVKNYREENFNFRLSSARIPIEISFGILVSRFRVLLGMLTLKLSTSINIVKCLVCLHNFLMTKDGSEEAYP